LCTEIAQPRPSLRSYGRSTSGRKGNVG
jgi:hypothetical protein